MFYLVQMTLLKSSRFQRKARPMAPTIGNNKECSLNNDGFCKHPGQFAHQSLKHKNRRFARCTRICVPNGGFEAQKSSNLPPVPHHHNPKSAHKSSTLLLTAASITIGVPHSRCVSPGHLFVASKPIFEPKPETGEAKSR